MYIPKQFSVTDRQQIVQFVKENSFGILVSNVDGVPAATHIPMLVKELDDGTLLLRGHIAKANAQWKHLHDRKALAIFHGPHAFISNKWYETPNAVSTWNYVAVHMHGFLRLIEDVEQFMQLLMETEQFYGGDVQQNDTSYVESLMKAIVGFEMKVTGIEGNWKLSQHHPKERRQKVVQQLSRQQDDNSQQIARLMQDSLK